MSRTKNPLVGKTVTAVYLADDQQAIRFDVEGSDPIIAWCDGDCCSYTWIEHIEGPERFIGTVAAVEDIDMPEQEYDRNKYEEVAFYGCKITTEKGSAVIDYRNSSNGYYGGSLEWPDRDYYGGVYGQNVSAEKWELIAGSKTR